MAWHCESEDEDESRKKREKSDDEVNLRGGEARQKWRNEIVEVRLADNFDFASDDTKIGTKHVSIDH